MISNGRKVHHINMQVPNLEKAIEFYTTALGYEVKARYNNGIRDIIFITDGNTIFELIEEASLETSVMEHIAYVSEDIEAEYKYFQELDSSMILTEIKYVDFLNIYIFFIKGAGNERIEFCQEKG